MKDFDDWHGATTHCEGCKAVIFIFFSYCPFCAKENNQVRDTDD